MPSKIKSDQDRIVALSKDLNQRQLPLQGRATCEVSLYCSKRGIVNSKVSAIAKVTDCTGARD
jgi:hypothetical protein